MHKFGSDKFDDLRFKYKKAQKFTTSELEELYDYIESAYKELENENETSK